MVSLSAYSDHAFIADGQNTSWSNLYTFVSDGSRVLDVGCSTGNFGAALSALKNCFVVGVDINAADIAIAATQLDAAHVLDVTSDTAVDTIGTFDVIVFADVLEHFDDPRAALRAAHRLLNPGGRVIYSIPNMTHVSVRLDLLAGAFPYTEIGLLDKTHLHFYDRYEVNAIFEDSGFAIVDEMPTISSYTEKLVTERLAALGVQPSPSFFSMLATTDGDIFQFVGIAEPSTGPAATPSLLRTTMLAPDLMRTQVENLQADNDRLDGELTALRSRIARLRRNPVGGIVSELAKRARKSGD